MKFHIAAIAAVAATFVALGAVGSAEARPGRGWDGPGWGGAGEFRRVAIVNRRIANQHRRIRRAARQGRLTWPEARRVRFELSHIRGFRARYLRDRRLSVREFRHLRRLLDRNSRRIARLANNRRGAERSGRLSRFNGF